MKTKKTHQDGADRMLVDNSWHSSIPLDNLKIDETFRVLNVDTREVIEWKVTEPSIQLSETEAKNEWLKYPFGDPKKAEKFGYFPYILRNLIKGKEIPPKEISPRYIPSEVRIIVWERDEGRCKNCGTNENLEFDHIVPVTKGGSNSENNIELLCKSCNLKKTNKII
jgi:hypothetical protein